jgi:hypothetical protein
MIRIILALTLILSLNTVSAELLNVNPDPKGEQWMAGGFRAPANFDRSKLDFMAQSAEKDKELPARVDNSLHKYFRPIFNQVGGSCSQAAGVGYTYTYEINRLRDLTANVTDNQYPTHFTYNFLNDGSGENGSWWGDGWEIITSSGIMNVKDYGGSFATGGNSRWISGITPWSNGQVNKIESYNSIDVGKPEGLNVLKGWLYDHNENSPYGGLAVFAAGATGYSEKLLPAGTHEAGKKVITKWGPDVNHAMTYVGYDDSVRFDYNGDGRYTNDVDINRDHVVDMHDWEIGAVIVANSWGDSFGDSGFIYQMYKLLADSYENGGIFYSFVDVVTPQIVDQPRWSVEVKMKHEQRNTYRISSGVSQNIYSSSPSNTYTYPFMKNQGGTFYPQGIKTEANKYIEFAIDITGIVGHIDPSRPFRYYFMLDENDVYNKYDGEIIDVAVIDNLTGRRYYNTSGSTPVVNHGKTTISVIIDENTFVPECLTAYAGDGIVKLNWSAPELRSTEFESFSVYRDGSLLESGLTECSYIDQDVTNGNLYTYKVAAVFSGTFTGEIMSFQVQAMPNDPSALPYFTDFEEGADGWTFSNLLTTGWLIGDTSFGSEYCDYTGNDTQFLLANPDGAGDKTVVIDHAVSPLFNISYYSGLSLDFDYILNNESNEFYFCDISVMYRTGLDQEWMLLEQLSDADSWTHKTINIPVEASGPNCTQISFYIDNYYRWSMGGGGIDNVSLNGTLATNAPSITAFTPENSQISLNTYESVQFSVTAEDQDTGSSRLQYLWYIDDVLVQSGNSSGLSSGFEKVGSYEIKVVVTDGYSEDSVIWTVMQTGTDENIPLATELYQNYPNPFNPETVIRFDNSAESSVKLTVYNSLGQNVRTLANGKLNAGRYSFVWDGKDFKGASLSSGLYYYRIEAGSYTKSHKMMLFK